MEAQIREERIRNLRTELFRELELLRDQEHNIKNKMTIIKAKIRILSDK